MKMVQFAARSIRLRKDLRLTAASRHAEQSRSRVVAREDDGVISAPTRAACSPLKAADREWRPTAHGYLPQLACSWREESNRSVIRRYERRCRDRNPAQRNNVE